MHILVIMDEFEKLDIAKDTSVGFILAAFRRNWAVSVCGAEDLFAIQNKMFASCRRIESMSGDSVSVSSVSSQPASAFGAVLMRLDPPVDVTYLHATHLLDLAVNETLVVNHPAGIRFANEKAYALQFPDDIPQTRITSRSSMVKDWVAESDEPLIIKPLDGHGGNGVFLLRNDDRNVSSIVETLTQHDSRVVVVQEYLPESRQGDKRVIMIDGEPSGTIIRIPRDDDHRGNIHVGGTVELADLSAAELSLCTRVGDRLRRDGLFFVGLDLIGGKLTEVNVTSPTGIREYYELTQIDLAETFLDFIEAQLG